MCPWTKRWVLGLVGIALVAGCSSAPPPEGEPELPPTPEEFAAGEALYDNGCASCHDSSKEGAPRLGFLRAWRRRMEAGEDTLVQHAIEGVGLMPPRGDIPELTDDEIRSIVRYMVYRAELNIPAKH
ncbi:MAG: c-type cytochrome [Planctomycetota bacterium]